MKKMRLIPLTLSCLFVAAITYGITTITVKPGQPLYEDGTVSQHSQAMAPIVGFARDGSAAVNKGRTIVTFNVYTSNQWFKRTAGCVTNSSGVAQPIRYKMGANTATSIAPSGCFDLRVNRGYTSLTVVPFSNASGASNTTYYWSHNRE